ncbi:hypothetical protein OH76DRAFT_1423750 [Lentinus brumalis]|uniref:Uncharacterized protein n=1 Tax=Lentinus brumalis TaxID=2498619 RepID=A0A371CJC2_9APHY|nr:hypothetical protein OH76DRAFT_1423750 [Polyporus brumalis]
MLEASRVAPAPSSARRRPSAAGSVASSNSTFTATTASSTSLKGKWAAIAPGPARSKEDYIKSLESMQLQPKAPSGSSNDSLPQRPFRSADELPQSAHREKKAKHRAKPPYPSITATLASGGSASTWPSHIPLPNDPTDVDHERWRQWFDARSQWLEKLELYLRTASGPDPPSLSEFMLFNVPHELHVPIAMLESMGFSTPVALFDDFEPLDPCTTIRRGDIIVVGRDLVVLVDEAVDPDRPSAATGQPPAATAAQFSSVTGQSSYGQPSAANYGQQYQLETSGAGPSSAYRDHAVHEGHSGTAGPGPATSSRWGYGEGNAVSAAWGEPWRQKVGCATCTHQGAAASDTESTHD